jgi:hypothetical protein
MHGAVSASGLIQNSNSTSFQEAPAYRARRRNWTVEKSVSLEDLGNELDANAPITLCETKCEKTYYKCPMRNRFECPMVVRMVRVVVTSLILIETCAMCHCYDDSNEKFRRGLFVLVQESIREITKLYVNIKPRTLHRSYSWIPTILVEEIVRSTKLLHICTAFVHARALHTWSTVFRAFVL